MSAPPHVGLPLTVEPTKPRLCINAGFVNLWMKASPFTLDGLSDVARFVYKLMVCVHHSSLRVKNVSVCLPHNRSSSIRFSQRPRYTLLALH